MELGFTLLILAGLGIGAVVGAAAFVSNFCALGGVADILFARDWRRMRAWILAAGVAIAGTQVLDTLNLINIQAILGPGIRWLPAFIGGTCFGFGMALAGGCVNRALVRLGAGSLKSLVIVLVVGVTSIITTIGVLAPINEALTDWGTLQLPIGIETWPRIIVAVMPAVDAEIARWIVTAAVAGGLIVFALKDAWFRTSRDQVIAGVLIGAMIPAAYYVAVEPLSLNFVAPVGDLMLMLFAGEEDGPLVAMAAVIGVPLGAFIAALATRNLALEVFLDRADFIRNLIGAALMGFGGTVALGCTFGQGLSMFSTLSISATISIVGILFGCLWGIRMFEAESVWGGLKLVFKRGV